MSNILQRVAAKAVLVNDEGKVLILREASTYQDGTNMGRYHLPGGRTEPGEKFFDALRREILEETGLAAEPLRPIYVGEWFPTIRGVRNHITAIFYACKASGSDVRLSDEHDKFVWIAPETYGDYDMMDPDWDVIRTWVDVRNR
jgi:8-oxo-dGTP diphosphatase